jgi:hypothetical protein
MSNIDSNHARAAQPTASPNENVFDVFDFDDEGLEPEPEHGDFWEECDDDCDIGR